MKGQTGTATGGFHHDADLLGIPVRLVLGEKSLAAGEIELLSGDMSRAEKVSIDRSRAAVVRELESLK